MHKDYVFINLLQSKYRPKSHVKKYTQAIRKLSDVVIEIIS